jgi:hypothetical protein
MTARSWTILRWVEVEALGEEELLRAELESRQSTWYKRHWSRKSP